MTWTAGKDDLTTPAWLLAELERKLGPIDLDPCGNPWSSVRANVTIGRHTSPACDGLAVDWLDYRLTFCNPPYSKIGPWAEKAAETMRAQEARRIDGRPRISSVVLLIPLSPSTRWWKAARAECSAFSMFHKRIRFEGPAAAFGSGRIESAAFYFGRSPYAYAGALEAHAETVITRHPLEGT